MTKAFLAIAGGQGAASARIRDLVAQLTDGVVNALARRQLSGDTFHIEDIQDQVGLALMRSGEARLCALSREAQPGAGPAKKSRATLESWPKSAAATPASRAASETAVSCRRTRWICLPSSAVVLSKWTGLP